ncbi:MAG: hypothetical protein P0Y55_18410 [Candidatus Cohnella colombiensis]|uniref:Uncharacterized protein n=1 Tax=Candidatus Cohnella colombiensis TaxID=3121368 RepID=A0AA95EWN6_9BACL|nr:MAG: hypothetical protein P0Y55_18410 [Cohnella sp.]
MRNLLVKGWITTIQHKYVLVLLFLYRLLWGFVFYRFIDSVVTPILSRYPKEHPNEAAAQLFLIEAQFRLLKTDLMNEALLTLGAMLFIRMLLTPVLNAGLYYSFHHAVEGEGTQVLTGIRRVWKPVTMLYWLENALILLPAIWLLPLAKERFFSEASLANWAQGLLPFAIAWIIGGFLIHLMFQFMQFSVVSKEGIMQGIRQTFRRGLPLLLLTLLFIGIAIAFAAVASSITLLWSGFIAVALHQTSHLIRSLITLWTAASQYHVWRET